MKILLIFLLLTARGFAAFTEFYVQSTGSNLNAGYPSTDDAGAIDDAATYTYAGGTFNGSTVFTVASGNPSSEGVDVNDFASIYTTSGASVATFVARITARDATTITVSSTAISGSAGSVSTGAGLATLKVGGAWAGPSGAVGFPFGFAAGTMKNVAGSWPRVNFKAGTYNITAVMAQNLAGPVQFSGYQTTPGDGADKAGNDTTSFATIDGGTTGSYYNLLQVNAPAQNNTFTDFIFTHNGNTGTTSNGDGVVVNEAECMFARCVFHDFRRHGIKFLSVGHLVECEAYACNQANDSTSSSAFSLSASGSTAIRCIAHHNTGSNCDGFGIGAANLIECIADSNGRNGAKDLGDSSSTVLQCDFYNNGAAGLTVGTGSGSMIANIQNCNFAKNVTYGINFVSTTVQGSLHNCGFGSGTMANGSGTYSTVHGIEIILTNLGSGSADGLYAANTLPWADAPNGDFDITLAAAKAAGRGAFATYNMGANTTVGFPDIGASQHLATGGTDRSYKLTYPRIRR